MNRTICMATGLAVLAAAGPASADYDRVKDPAGDNTSSPDIVEATHEHTVSGRLKHTVTTRHRISRRRPPQLQIETFGGEGHENPCGPDYAVGPKDLDEDGVYEAETCGPHVPLENKTGSLDLERAGDHKLRYVFGEHAIGRPDRYEWSFVYPDESFCCVDDRTEPHRHRLR